MYEIICYYVKKIKILLFQPARGGNTPMTSERHRLTSPLSIKNRCGSYYGQPATMIAICSTTHR